MQKRNGDHFLLSRLFPEQIPQNAADIPGDLSGCLLVHSGCDRRPDLFQDSRRSQFSLFPGSRQVPGSTDRVNLIADPQVVLVAQIGGDYDILYFAAIAEMVELGFMVPSADSTKQSRVFPVY